MASLDPRIFNMHVDHLGNEIRKFVIQPVTTDPSEIKKEGGIVFVKNTSAANDYIKYYASGTLSYALIHLDVQDAGFNNSVGILQYGGYGGVSVHAPSGDKAMILNSGTLRDFEIESTSAETYGTKLGFDGTVNNRFATAKAIKAYVDSIASGFTPLDPCDASFDDSTSSVPTSPTGLTIDGHSVVDGDRILVIKSDDGNGYSTKILTSTSSNTAWTTYSPSDGDMVLVKEGTVRGGTLWAYDSTKWVQIGMATDYTASEGVQIATKDIRLDFSHLGTTTLSGSDVFAIYDVSASTHKKTTLSDIGTALNIPSVSGSEHQVAVFGASNSIGGIALPSVDNKFLIGKAANDPSWSAYTVPTTGLANTILYFASNTEVTRSEDLKFSSNVLIVKNKLKLTDGTHYLQFNVKNGTSSSYFFPASTALSVGNALVIDTINGDDISLTTASFVASAISTLTFNGIALTSSSIDINVVGSTNQVVVSNAGTNPTATATLSLANVVYLDPGGNNGSAVIGATSATNIKFDNAPHQEGIKFYVAGSGSVNVNKNGIDWLGATKPRLGYSSAVRSWDIYAYDIYAYGQAEYSIPYVGASSKFMYLVKPSSKSFLSYDGTEIKWVAENQITDPNTTVITSASYSGTTQTYTLSSLTTPIASNSPIQVTVYDNDHNQVEADITLHPNAGSFDVNTVQDIPSNEPYTVVIVGIPG